MRRGVEPPAGWIGDLLIQQAIERAQRDIQQAGSRAAPIIAWADAWKHRQQVFVNFQSGRLGDWKRSIAFSEINRAILEPTIYSPNGPTYFRFGKTRGMWFRVALYSPAGVLIDARSLDVTRRIIDRSSIEKLPRSTYDPNGRFDAVLPPGDFPNSRLSKSEAIATLGSMKGFDVE